MGVLNSYTNIVTADGTEEFVVIHGGSTKNITSSVLRSYISALSVSATVSAGTNAQGQGALTSDYNVITTAANNPSGVTLPTATVGRTIFIVNRGANRVVVYPATGATIDTRSVNAGISLPVGDVIEFKASSTTQWYSTASVSYEGNLFSLVDQTDPTKTAVFSMASLTTGTTRTYTLPDADGVVATSTADNTFSGDIVFSKSIATTMTTGAISFGSAQTTGTVTIGGTTQTGTLTFGRSTGAQTLDIGVGATTGGVTKAINIGTQGLSTSITNINIGSAVSGATGTLSVGVGLNTVFGHSAALSVPATTGAAITPTVQSPGTTLGGSAYSAIHYSTGVNASASVILARSYNAALGSHTAIDNNVQIGAIVFAGSDGSAFVRSARIYAEGAALATSGNVPSRLHMGVTDVTGTYRDAFQINEKGVLVSPPVDFTGAASSTTSAIKFQIGVSTYTDNTTATSGTAAHGTVLLVRQQTIAAANTGVTYTNASSIYIQEAPLAGTNVTITNRWALFSAAGNNAFVGNVRMGGGSLPTNPLSVTGNADISGDLVVSGTITGTMSGGLSTEKAIGLSWGGFI